MIKSNNSSRKEFSSMNHHIIDKAKIHHIMSIGNSCKNIQINDQSKYNEKTENRNDKEKENYAAQFILVKGVKFYLNHVQKRF